MQWLFGSACLAGGKRCDSTGAPVASARAEEGRACSEAGRLSGRQLLQLPQTELLLHRRQLASETAADMIPLLLRLAYKCFVRPPARWSPVRTVWTHGNDIRHSSTAQWCAFPFVPLDFCLQLLRYNEIVLHFITYLCVKNTSENCLNFPLPKENMFRCKN